MLTTPPVTFVAGDLYRRKPAIIEITDEERRKAVLHLVQYIPVRREGPEPFIDELFQGVEGLAELVHLGTDRELEQAGLLECGLGLIGRGYQHGELLRAVPCQ